MRRIEGFALALGLLAAMPVQALMWHPVANDESSVVSLNQDSLVVRGRAVAAEFQFVFKRTLSAAYADDTRIDSFRRMKTWVEADCAAGTLKVLERTLIGEKGERVAEGVPTALRAARPSDQLDAAENRMLTVACGGVLAAD